MIEQQLKDLAEFCSKQGYGQPLTLNLPNGGTLVSVDAVGVEGWNRSEAKALFVAPPGFPAAQPDCFWVTPSGFRLADGGTPKASNDSNPIPGDIESGRSTTWFSWHVQVWNPSRDSLTTYFKVVLDRLKPAR